MGRKQKKRGGKTEAMSQKALAREGGRLGETGGKKTEKFRLYEEAFGRRIGEIGNEGKIVQ